MWPFDGYEGNGRKLLGPVSLEDSARHNYALPFLSLSGGKCVYCDHSLIADYDSWLNLSIDHVVPTRSVKEEQYPAKWVADAANVVASCRACNEFLNGFRVHDPVPTSEEEFFALRDRVLEKKRAHAQKRHNEEQSFYAGKTRKSR